MNETDVRIEYCVECLYLDRALEVAKAILTAYHAQIGAVRIVPGTRGVFRVTVDGQVLFQLKEGDWHLPNPELIQRDVGRALRVIA
jgi:selenoprotein W-related protein